VAVLIPVQQVCSLSSATHHTKPSRMTAVYATTRRTVKPTKVTQRCCLMAMKRRGMGASGNSKLIGSMSSKYCDIIAKAGH